jgi:hypothetical protein
MEQPGKQVEMLPEEYLEEVLGITKATNVVVRLD